MSRGHLRSETVARTLALSGSRRVAEVVAQLVGFLAYFPAVGGDGAGGQVGDGEVFGQVAVFIIVVVVSFGQSIDQVQAEAAGGVERDFALANFQDIPFAAGIIRFLGPIGRDDVARGVMEGISKNCQEVRQKRGVLQGPFQRVLWLIPKWLSAIETLAPTLICDPTRLL